MTTTPTALSPSPIDSSRDDSATVSDVVDAAALITFLESLNVDRVEAIATVLADLGDNNPALLARYRSLQRLLDAVLYRQLAWVDF